MFEPGRIIHTRPKQQVELSCLAAWLSEIQHFMVTQVINAVVVFPLTCKLTSCGMIFVVTQVSSSTAASCIQDADFDPDLTPHWKDLFEIKLTFDARRITKRCSATEVIILLPEEQVGADASALYHTRIPSDDT